MINFKLIVSKNEINKKKKKKKKHVPKFTRNKIKPQKDLPRRQCKSAQNAPVSADSAIGQHLLNKISAEKFDSTGSLF